ncbi:MAG: hypothetical protein AB7U95_00410 [Reyranella sp.]
MATITSDSSREQLMKAAFEARLPARVDRASRVGLQHFIPDHWFSAAASECGRMFVDGYFYGTISVAQAYGEALSKFLCQIHRIRVPKSVEQRFQRLAENKIISDKVLQSLSAIRENRHEFHHLNADVPADASALEQRAEDCINHLFTIESEVFAYTMVSPGTLAPIHPEYWPGETPNTVRVHLRNLL